MRLFRRLITGRSDHILIHVFRSICSSSIGFAVDVGLLALLVEVGGLHYLVAASISFFAGTSITYLFSVLWIFPRRRLKRKSMEYLVFFGVGIIGIALNDVLMWTFTEQFSVYYLYSKFISAVMVFFCNFAARKYLLFR